MGNAPPPVAEWGNGAAVRAPAVQRIELPTSDQTGVPNPSGRMVVITGVQSDGGLRSLFVSGVGARCAGAHAAMDEGALRMCVTKAGASEKREACNRACENNGIKVYAEDTGSGIPEELHEKVFQRFMTFSNSLSTSFFNSLSFIIPPLFPIVSLSSFLPLTATPAHSPR